MRTCVSEVRALGMCLLYGPRRALFLMSEVPFGGECPLSKDTYRPECGPMLTSTNAGATGDVC